LSVRWRECPDCGTSQRRVVIAAQNIHWRAQRLRALVGLPAGTREAPCGDEARTCGAVVPAECQV
jgi:hypothetical protein